MIKLPTLRTLTASALILCLLPTPTLAISEDPIELIRVTTERVLDQLIQTPEIKSDPDKLKILIEEYVLPSIDFMRLSRLTLGKHWGTATATQRQRFTDEFKQLLIRTYSTPLTEYNGQDIEYLHLKTTPDGKRSGVRTRLRQSGGAQITVDYSLYQTRDGWKIYDVTIEGVSLVVNYRSSFSQEIRTHGLDGLIQHLAVRNR
jgi:phospholipid transport system substrate-binding protein